MSTKNHMYNYKSGDYKSSKYDNGKNSDELISFCEDIVEKLIISGINFFAVDFDDTLISVHTESKWDKSAADLAVKVRPFFKILIPQLIHRGFCIAIVTFSNQCTIIYDVLRVVFPKLHDRIVIRGNDGSWEHRSKTKKEGKQHHMASAAEYLQKKFRVTITRSSTLLVDDHADNIWHALTEYVRAVRYYPDSPDRIIDDLLEANL